MQYTEGHQTIFNEDGSRTHITVEHELPEEPLSTLSLILWTTGLTVVGLALGGAPIWLEVMAEKRAKMKRLADRQKSNREIFHQLKPS